MDREAGHQVEVDLATKLLLSLQKTRSTKPKTQMQSNPSNRSTFRLASLGVALVVLASSGCVTSQGPFSPKDNTAFTNLVQARFEDSHPIAQSRDLNAIADVPVIEISEPVIAQETAQQVRAQSPDSSAAGSASRIPASGNGQGVQQTAYQYPDAGAAGGIVPSFATGQSLAPPVGFNQAPGQVPLNTPVGQSYADFGNFADLDVFVGETRTGSIQLGGAFNSDNGIVGQLTIDERNFDIRNLPRNFREIWDGTAFRGGGQAFRLELVPGNEVQRYLVSLSEPYLFGTDYSFSISGFLFDRDFFDWEERRLGGRVSIGRRLTPDLSISAGLRLEDVEIETDRPGISPSLDALIARGNTDLYSFNVGLIRDTRDHPFLATEGSYLALTYTQGFGEFDFPRGDIEYRRYRLLRERPDGSGRHTLSVLTKLGVTGSGTPIYENFFAGGFSTLRGFDFRGAAPIEGGVDGVRVGGQFQWINTVEYQFPVTADDMIKAVAFVDFGTVEENVEINSENFRVAPGVGLRVHVPALGGGAPLAFDFAFPVETATGDEEQVFSFYIQANR